MPPRDQKAPLLLSYLELRKSIGVIGILLPGVLALGKLLLEGGGLLPSISAYIYSDMSGVFVGSLSAVGVFLWSYRGYELKDMIASQIAAYSAIGIALFPTTPAAGAMPSQATIGMFHLAFAFVFFSSLIYFALALFRKTDPTKPPTREKRMRNTIYLICGFTMLIAMLILIIMRFLPADAPIFALNPVFWLESVMIEAFGISWLVKGEAILKDA